MMTEDEARTKRCCGPEGCGSDVLDSVRWCIASECMAWEWLDWSKDETGRNELPLRGDCGLKR